MLLEKTQVKMLPTEKASKLYLLHGKLNLSLHGDITVGDGDKKPQHLYILSDEELKEGDWVLADGGIRYITRLNNDEDATFIDDGKLSKQKPSNRCYLKHYKKIIATMNPELWKYVAKIPLDFVGIYIKEYNTGKPIEWVNIECEICGTEDISCLKIVQGYDVVEGAFNYGQKLKLNSNGTVKVFPINKTIFNLLEEFTGKSTLQIDSERLLLDFCKFVDEKKYTHSIVERKYTTEEVVDIIHTYTSCNYPNYKGMRQVREWFNKNYPI